MHVYMPNGFVDGVLVEKRHWNKQKKKTNAHWLWHLVGMWNLFVLRVTNVLFDWTNINAIRTMWRQEARWSWTKMKSFWDLEDKYDLFDFLRGPKNSYESRYDCVDVVDVCLFLIKHQVSFILCLLFYHWIETDHIRALTQTHVHTHTHSYKWNGVERRAGGKYSSETNTWNIFWRHSCLHNNSNKNFFLKVPKEDPEKRELQTLLPKPVEIADEEEPVCRSRTAK